MPLVVTGADSYLDLAEAVLRRIRAPLSTRQIMRAAYLSDMVPPHLHGVTQHKTLGARLSEDILRYRLRSRFFRTRPGRFFLRSFIKDKTLPLEFRTPIVARRRIRDLKRNDVAAIPDQVAIRMLSHLPAVGHESSELRDIVQSGVIRYGHLDKMANDRLCPIYSYVIIQRADHILIHSKGLYAEQRKGFVGRQMLGFPVPICHDDMTLFDIEDHGVVSAGLTAVAIDLDLEFSAEFPSFEQSAHLASVHIVPEPIAGNALLCLVKVSAPSEFDPVGRRLAVQDLSWMLTDDALSASSSLDPWSRIMAQEASSFIRGGV
jgi:hypothetical protein